MNKSNDTADRQLSLLFLGIQRLTIVLFNDISQYDLIPFKHINSVAAFTSPCFVFGLSIVYIQ